MASIFISYSSRDKGIARQLASDLKHYGHDVWLDEWKIKVGQCIPTEIERGVQGADFVILLLSPHAVQSNWVDREWKMAYWNEVNANSIVVLPVLLEECEIPELIQTKKYANFSKSYAIGFHELVSAIDSYEFMEATVDYIEYTINVPQNAPPYIKQAVAALDSASPAERKAAVETLAQTSHPAAREALAEAAQHPIRDVRILAAFMLVEFKDVRAVPGLLEAMCDKDSELGECTAKALRRIRDADVPDVFDSTKPAADWPMYGAAIWALGQIGDAGAISGLLNALRDRSVDVRVVAAWALGEIGDARAVEPLIAALKDGDRRVREAAVEALGQIGDADVISGLLDALCDEDWPAREAAADALGQIGDATAVPDLLGALRDETWLVRKAAAESLGQIGDATAVPGLLDALHDRVVDIQKAAVRALEHIGTPEAVAAAEEWQLRDRRSIDTGD